MSYSLNGSSNDDRVDQLRRQHQQRQTRFFIAFAVIEGFAFITTLIVVFALGLVDADLGVWILLAIALIGGAFMSVSLLAMRRRHSQEIRDITGYPG
ncbi:hypothetical protein ACTU6U_15195 [Microbacterium sp. A196]|uniref:hypothetical protein n=1 Tax=unclassified Microbacterium TaxID=2609290 RepID=UPI003FD27841